MVTTPVEVKLNQGVVHIKMFEPKKNAGKGKNVHNHYTSQEEGTGVNPADGHQQMRLLVFGEGCTFSNTLRQNELWFR